MDISDNFNGGGDIVRRLQLMTLSGQKMTKLTRLVGAAMVSSTEERFSNQRAPDGSPWLPSKRAIEQSGKTLRDTGRLIASLTYVQVPNGVRWGTNVKYAAMMNFGGRKSTYSNLWGDIPARPFMGVNDADAETIENIIANIIGE